MTLVGLTALSVEIITNASTPLSMASSTRVLVPKTLFLTASPGLASIIGTCLCAAAWKTTSGECRTKTVRRRAASVMLATHGIMSASGAQGSQLAFEEEQAILGVVQQDQLPGAEREDLAADLRADAAGGAGDQDDPIVEESADRLAVEMDRLPAEQVMDIDIPGPNIDGAAQQGGERGDDLDFHPQRAASGGQCAQALSGERPLRGPGSSGSPGGRRGVRWPPGARGP